MKRIIVLILTCATLLCAGACGPKFETVPGDPMSTQIYTLQNGLQLYMTVNKEEPRIQTYIAVRAGGKNGPDTSTGLAHYFEHLMFKGTQQFGTSDYAAEEPLLNEIEDLFNVYRKTTDEAERAAIYHKIDSISYEASKIAIPNEYDKLMALIGAKGTNAWTSMDETVYQEDIPSNQIDNWARIQADRFKNVVLRGFHTELETIYEEKNMSLTQDSRKIWEVLDGALFPNHPYGQRTVLGTQEHLKNPSITDVKHFHDDFYVPNNIRICVSGDFDPKEMAATVEKYFGDWEPNPDVPLLEVKEEAPITSPIEKDVFGLEAEQIAMGWRLPAARDLKNSAIAEIAGSILSNGKAGLIDLDVNQQQKCLSLFSGSQIQPDYSEFIVMGRPKQGQTLEQVRDIALEEIAKLRSGDFDEELIPATINNEKLSLMRSLESNSARANKFINAFINGIEWKDAVTELDRLEAVTKDDVVAWANEFLGADNYVAVYKRIGVDDSVQKISAPAITPIESNRDKQSAFLLEIQNSEVKPIEPVFADFSKDMSAFDYKKGVNVLYKQNELNDIFNIQFAVNLGTENDPALNLAASYLEYLGTPEMSAEQIASKMYSLACSFNISAGSSATTFSVNGLSENMAEAIKIGEDLIANAVPDENVLEMLKDNMIKSRMDSKKSQRSCYSALQRYCMYDEDYIRSITLTNEQIRALTSEQLLAKLRETLTKGHEISYYGPMNEEELKSTLNSCHYVSPGATALPETHPVMKKNDGNSVVLAQYDAKQIYYLQYSNRGELFDPASKAEISLYNNYFGGGMNSIVFQEMREARGLAYSASAHLGEPQYTDAPYVFTAFIATQNDKMQTAIEAFDDIINNMPESEAAFQVAKESLVTGLRTKRTTGMGVLSSYKSCRHLGISEPLDRQVFEKVQNMTLDDVKAVQKKWIKDRDYTYMILGDIADLDLGYLKTLGPVKTVSLEEIFGY